MSKVKKENMGTILVICGIFISLINVITFIFLLNMYIFIILFATSETLIGIGKSEF
jgi:hypothetical protein